MISDAVELVTELEHEYVRCLDEDELERWPELFLDAGRYEVLSRENLRNTLDLPIMFCDSKVMMQDRILSLRKTTIFNIHYDRHVISNMSMRRHDDGTYRAVLNFALFQTDIEGKSRLFVVGSYDDLIVIDGKSPKFSRKRVILDTFCVPNMISTPV